MIAAPGKLCAMSSAALSVSVTRGVIAAFNPCGFAMLPAYVSYFVGTNAGGTVDRTILRLRRAVLVALTTTAGFVVLFSVLGFITTVVTDAVSSFIPWASIVIGVGLVALGLALLLGHELKLSTQRFSGHRAGTGLGAMFVYGVSYATVSTGCQIGTFLSNVRGGGVADQMVGWVAYALGMGLVLTVVSLAAALAQQAFLRGMRKVLPYINRISGALLVATGVYVIWYGWVEWQTTRFKSVPRGPEVLVGQWSARISTWIQELGTGPLIVAGLLTLGSIVSIFVIGRRKPQEGSLT